MGLRRLGWSIATSVAFLNLVGVARAHRVGGSQFESPIPLAFLYAGAGLTVVVTALWLGAPVRTSIEEAIHWSRTLLAPSVTTPIRLLVRVGFFALVTMALVHGLIGRQVPAENLATVLVWPVMIKGISLVAILVGSPWRLLSPWESLLLLFERVEGEELGVLGDFPSALGSWVAALGFVLGIGIIENLTLTPRSPRTTSLLLASYALVMVLGGVGFGRSWFRRADVFDVLFRLFGRVAPFHLSRTSDGGYELEARPPWRGCTTAEPDASLVAMVVAMVYTVSFDGFVNTPEYQTILFGARELLGTGSPTAVGLYLGGLVGFIGSFLLTSAIVERVGSGTWTAWRSAARAFAPTVLPIAAAYEVAHNYPFVASNLGQAVTIGLEALTGFNGPAVAPLGWLSLPAFWISQVVLIVGGHVVAVVAAHRVATDRFPTRVAARRAHFPLVVAMVGYTVLSLWIISRPVISG